MIHSTGIRKAGGANPAIVSAVLNDWLYTASWLNRLETGESLADLIESYRAKQ